MTDASPEDSAVKNFRMDATIMVEANSFEEAANKIAAHIIWIGKQFGDDPEDYDDHTSPILVGDLEIGQCDDKGNPVKIEAT